MIWSASASLAVIAACAMVWLLREAATVILPLVIAALLAYALDPIVDRLVRLRLPRTLASIVAVCVLLGTLGLGARLLWPQVESLVAKVPEAAAEVRSAVRRYRQASGNSTLQRVQAAARAIDSAAAEAGRPLTTTPGVTRVEVQQPWRASDWLWTGSIGAVGLAGQAVVILALTIVLLTANDFFKRQLIQQMSTLGGKRITVQILKDIERQIERFILVQALTSAIVAVVTGVALWALGVEEFAAWGLFAGVLNVVPYFGAMVVTVALGVAAFLQFGTLEQAALVAGVALAITTLEGLWLTPQLLSRTAELNSVAILVAIAFWTWMWGVPGLLLAIPMLMVVKATCDHIEELRGIAAFLGRP
jgi:predicted PurR-regulated permease PerM